MAGIDLSRLEARIRAMNSHEFASLCNELLVHEALRLGIPRTSIRITRNIEEPDGGVDARIDDCPNVNSQLFRAAASGFQFKSGTSRSTASIAADDIVAKPQVVALLTAGGSFTYMAAWDREVGIDQKIRDAVRETHGLVGIRDEQFDFLGTASLASLVAAAPAVVARLLGIADECFTIEHWGAFENLRNNFIGSADIDERVAALRERVGRPSSRVRVTGSAGDGKTRLVLEALRGSDLSDATLYVPSPDAVPAGLLTTLRGTPDSVCVLVVDEVEEDRVVGLRNALAAAPPGVRLVMIGVDADREPGAEVIVAPRLQPAELVQIVKSICGAQDDVAAEVADACEGSPKLAVVLALRLRERPDLRVSAGFLGDHDARSALDRYIPNLASGDRDWQALSIIAIVRSIGWDEKFAVEADGVFALLGVDAADGRRRVEALHAKYGIAPKGGRFRYVSPVLLGDHLAAQQVGHWPAERIRGVFDSLSPGLTARFAWRLRRLSEVLKNKKVVEEVLLGEGGPFRRLRDVEAGAAFAGGWGAGERSPLVSVLRELAAPFPDAAMTAIERIVGPASDSELAAAKHSRRDLVFTLEVLLWPKSLFVRAAAVLLRLAMNENETYGNNASEVWRETFQMFLGRTAAPHAPRMHALRAAVSTGDARALVLAAGACQSALKTSHVSRVGMPPSQFQTMPKEEWQPASHEEWLAAYRDYLTMAGELSGHASPDVRNAAAQAIAEAADAAVEDPDLRDTFTAAATRLAGAPFDDRHVVAQHLEAALGVDHHGVDDEGQAPVDIGEPWVPILRVLRGDDFGSRFRAALAEKSWSRGGAAQSEFASLAREIVAEPGLLESQVPWLLEHATRFSAAWVVALGTADEQGALEPVLRGMAAANPTTAYWLAIYDAAVGRRLGRDSYLSERAATLRAAGYQGIPLLVYISMTPPNEDVMKTLLSALKAGEVPRDRLELLGYYEWSSGLTSGVVQEIWDAVDREQSSAPGLVGLIGSILDRGGTLGDADRAVALPLLVASAQFSGAGIDSWHWTQVALRMAESAPEAVAEACAVRAASGRLSIDHELEKAFSSCWERGACGTIFLKTIGPRLLDRSEVAFSIDRLIEHVDLGAAGVERVLAWVAKDPKPRAWRLAHALGKPSRPMSDLQSELLRLYGDDGVGNEYSCSFQSGAFWGDESSYFRGQRKIAESWMQDERPHVRQWAERLIRGLDAQIARAERDETEQRM